MGTQEALSNAVVGVFTNNHGGTYKTFPITINPPTLRHSAPKPYLWDFHPIASRVSRLSMKFEDYSIAFEIKKNLSKMGFNRPTDIQFKAVLFRRYN